MAKKIEIIKECVLFDEIDTDYDVLREEYAECNDISVEEIDDNRFYDWVYMVQRDEWECLESNIKYSKYNTDCVITGQLGLWNGRPTIQPVRCNSVIEALDKIVNNANGYIKVTLKNGCIEVAQAHHDGTNYFEIHILNKLGRDTMGADLTKECYYLPIRGYIE